ncbi:MAG: hypothetical protein OXI72_24405 [Gemmatimonadota bacterium]|nr:hypothetical protein [Gemmatimonadota bacterium]
MSESVRCEIWPEFYAKHISISDSDLFCIESPRAGGKYQILFETAGFLKELKDDERARLTTWLLDMQSQGVSRPQVNEEVINYAKNQKPLSVFERANRLLRFIAAKTERPGNRIEFLVENRDNIKTSPELIRPKDLRDEKQKNTYFAYAWSEATSWEEVKYYFSYMRKKGWIECSHPSITLDPDHIGSEDKVPVILTIDGYNQIEDLDTKIDSTQAFVAMWFDEKMKKVYEEGLKPAIENAGYKSMRIDRKPDLDKIDDEIIKEIRQSLFLVADMTHGKNGARGGVYYEAGFAYGLGKSVIYTCHKDMIKEEKIHFDTRQYAHITWEEENLEKLRKELHDRIIARIGKGPI